MQAAILWELSHALKHNFFADLADRLLNTFSRNSDEIPNEKEEQIATLQAKIDQIATGERIVIAGGAGWEAVGAFRG
jgi:dihydrofolate reductase